MGRVCQVTQADDETASETRGTGWWGQGVCIFVDLQSQKLWCGMVWWQSAVFPARRARALPPRSPHPPHLPRTPPGARHSTIVCHGLSSFHSLSLSDPRPGRTPRKILSLTRSTPPPGL